MVQVDLAATELQCMERSVWYVLDSIEEVFLLVKNECVGSRLWLKPAPAAAAASEGQQAGASSSADVAAAAVAPPVYVRASPRLDAQQLLLLEKKLQYTAHDREQRTLLSLPLQSAVTLLEHRKNLTPSTLSRSDERQRQRQWQREHGLTAASAAASGSESGSSSSSEEDEDEDDSGSDSEVVPDDSMQVKTAYIVDPFVCVDPSSKIPSAIPCN